MLMSFLPDLAVNTPLWLILLTIGVNALVGSLRAFDDEKHSWDIVGVSVFAILMGLGGGFIRDILIGNTPVESLRTPWPLLTVLIMIVTALLFGRFVSKLTIVVSFLNAVAMGLFALTGSAYALREGLPVLAAIFVGVVSSVGGGVLVSVVKDEVPGILVSSAPNALIALLVSIVYVSVDMHDSAFASLAAILTAVVVSVVSNALGVRTRKATNVSALLPTRSKDT